jgi:capsular polysaccharide biosynthesis protein
VRVLSLADGRLLWPEASVVTADDALLTDTSFWALCDDGRLHRHPLGRRWSAPPQRRLKGRVLSLASDHAGYSFGHLLLDALPRLGYVQRAGYRLDDFDWIVLPHPPSATADRLITAARLPRDRIINPRLREDFVCDELVCTTFPGWPGYYSPELPAFYRQLLGLKPTRGTLRIYLSRQRQSRRRLAHAAEVEAVLARHGFETVYPESDPQVIDKCADADFIVGIEGSNFTNQVFAPPGGAVLLLLADNWHDLPYVYTVATAAGKAVFALNCAPVIDPADSRAHWTNPHDLVVDLAALDTALSEMLTT